MTHQGPNREKFHKNKHLKSVYFVCVKTARKVRGVAQANIYFMILFEKKILFGPVPKGNPF